METRFYYRASQHLRCSLSHSHSPYHTLGAHSSIRNIKTARKRDSINRSRVRYASTQTNPVGGFYESLLESPLSPPLSDPAATKLDTKPPPPDQPKGTSSEAQKEEVAAKARIVFGSRLAGPAERRQVKDRGSQVIAGVRVPPKPVEPDNCCMSGCVNCVWDVYGDDMEEWARMTKKADRALAAQQRRKGGTGLMLREGEHDVTHTMISMDDDGGGSETNWGSTEDDMDINKEALFSNLPVGIREFMKQEKRLKEKHMREGSKGG